MISMDICDSRILCFLMAMCETSTAKPILSLKDNPGRIGNRNTSSQVNPDSIPPSPRSLPSRADLINEGTSHQLWMQEYHNSRQSREGCTDLKQKPVISNGYTGISLLLPNPSASVNGATVELNALKITPEVNEVHKHGQKEPAMSLKRNKTDLLDGYKVYRGPTSVTLGITRNHTENATSSVESPKCATYHHQDTKDVIANDYLRRPNLPSFYYPDPLLISKHVGKDGPNQKINSSHFHVAKSHSLPYRAHFPSRPRPQSATLSSSSQKSDEKAKGTKSKHHLRKGKPPLQVPTKTSSLKQGQSSKLTDSPSTQHRGSFSISPRQLGTIPRPSYKLDVNGRPKHETHACLTPKSILKNNSYADANSYLAIHSLKPSQELSRDTSGRISPYLLPQDLSLNDFLLSPRESSHNRTPLSVPSWSSSTSHATSSTSRTVMGPKRPTSAVTNPSKYELNETHPSGRKSVTFNSYVSLMTGNRVSTIRSLSVDA